MTRVGSQRHRKKGLKNPGVKKNQCNYQRFLRGKKPHIKEQRADSLLGIRYLS